MIGRTVTFIRLNWGSGNTGVKEAREYTGIVLDKISGWENIEGSRHRANYYLVELPDGIIGKFFCDEAVKIVPVVKSLN